MSEYKTQVEFYNYSSKYLDLLRQHDNEWFNDYTRFIKENIHKSSRGMDIGCGMGLTIKLLSELGYDTIGIDISKKFLEKGAKEYNLHGGKLVCADALHLPFADKSFDFVSSIDFIEHVHNINDLLKEMARISKTSIVIFSPNYYDIFTWIKNLLSTVLMKKSLFTFAELLKFSQLLNLTLKIIGLYPLKVFGIHKKPISFNPILSDKKIGGDYDLAWIINYFDIKNILKRHGFYIKNKTPLYAKTRSFIKIFAVKE